MSVSKAKIGIRPLYFNAAPEPSNVLWENLSRSTAERRIRGLIAFVCIAAILSFSFIMFFYFRRMKDDSKSGVYPQNVIKQE
jgi:hypothetical protein